METVLTLDKNLISAHSMMPSAAATAINTVSSMECVVVVVVALPW
jgi:hypothetical protein